MIKAENYYEAFCPECHYRCLMPVEFAGEDENTIVYKKIKCNCAKVKAGTCDKSTSCEHYLAAPDEIDIASIVHM